MKKTGLSGILLFFFTFLAAQPLQTKTSADIYQGLQKLNVLGSVLYIAAHPDDENTRLLTYLANEKMYRTGYLSLTRGDGGQNLIGNEQGIELGLIRTQELLSARRIDGAEQFFTRAYDFGFSKNPEETFTKWDREKILADVVWVIRKFRPDVIITRFPTTGEGGHGHHTASAILANEAFTAAADPKRFPDQLKWVEPWGAKRIFWNLFNFGGNNPQPGDGLKIDVGAYNPVLGKSYGEIAAESRSQHKSQGFGSGRNRGEAFEFLKLTGGASPGADIMDDIEVSWKRVEDGEKMVREIQNTITTFSFPAPQKSIPQLVTISKILRGLKESYWKTQKLKELYALIEQASGLWLDVFATEQYIAQTDSLRIGVSLNNRLGSVIKLNKILIENYDTIINKELSKNQNLVFTKVVYVSPQMPVTQPYWLKNKMEEGYFNVPDQQLIGEPDVQPSFTVSFTCTIEGESFVFKKPVKFKSVDPVKGELYQPLTVVPPVSVYTDPDLILLTKSNGDAKSITVRSTANKSFGDYKATITTKLLSGQASLNDSAKGVSKGTSKLYTFPIQRATIKGDADLAVPVVNVNPASAGNSLAMTTIRYDHIPAINYFYADAVKILNIDLKTAGKKLGYITGAGDKVPQALEDMGYEVTLLTDIDLSRSKLNTFDAILTGVRAYNTAEWLNRHYEKLMNYVKEGGNLIVQYNTSTNIGPVRARIGPYSFDISRGRITDENAPVTFLNPAHPVLNSPNKITTDDFRGWLQERSIYHAINWDKNFEAILSMNDRGEQPDAGSLIIAPYGKGYFTYTGLVFFRELPAGVPGAYRLLANLIALNSEKTF